MRVNKTPLSLLFAVLFIHYSCDGNNIQRSLSAKSNDTGSSGSGLSPSDGEDKIVNGPAADTGEGIADDDNVLHSNLSKEEEKEEESYASNAPVLEGSFKGKTVSVQTGSIVNATLEIQPASLPAEMSHLDGISMTGDPMLITLKDANSQTIDSTTVPFDITLALPEVSGLVAPTYSNLCMLLRPSNPADRPIAFRPELLQIAGSKLSFRTKAMGVFVMAYCGHKIIAGFGEASRTGDVYDQVPEWSKETILPDSKITDAIILPDGKILAVGSLKNVSNLDMLVMQINRDGSLDTSFGPNKVGWSTIPSLANPAYTNVTSVGYSVKIHNNSIFITGSSPHAAEDYHCVTVVKLTLSGNLDPSFNGTGKRRYCTEIKGSEPALRNDSVPGDIEFDGNDNIYVLAVTTNSVLDGKAIDLMRIKKSGEWDSSFGVEGKYRYVVPGQNAYARRMLVDRKDRIYICGSVSIGVALSGFVQRIKSDGNLDTTFASAGQFNLSNIDAIDSRSSCRDIRFPPGGGRILLAATGSKTNSSLSGVIAAIRSTGSFDNTFGGGHGYTIAPPQGTDKFLRHVDLAFDSFRRIHVSSNLSPDITLRELTGSMIFRFSEDGELMSDWQNNGSILYEDPLQPYYLNSAIVVDIFNRTVVGGVGFNRP